MPRTLRSLLLTVTASAAVLGAASTAAVATAAVATAAPAVTPTSAGIAGDVTGDGRSDRVTLGSNGAAVPGCSARVQPGTATGFGVGAYRRLPVRGAPMVCPDLGTVVAGPAPDATRLAVTWSSVPPAAGRSVQFFRWTVSTATWTYDGGTNGQFQPSTLTSRDVDGDRYGDLVETTDQGGGIAVYVGRGSSYSRLWTSSPSTDDRLSFADFDHRAGVDVLDGHAFFGTANVGVTVVDGRTGTVLPLIVDRTASPSTYVPRAVDVNRDGWLDIRVQVFAADGSARPDVVFRNRANGRFVFVRV